MYPSRFRYAAPRTLDEAIALLAEHGDDAKVLAGGQSLVPLLKLRFAAPALLVDINNLPGLGHHREDGDGTLRVGALCRHADLERSTLLPGRHPLMAVGGAAGRRPDRAQPRHARRLGLPRRPAGRLGRGHDRAGRLDRRAGPGRAARRSRSRSSCSARSRTRCGRARSRSRRSCRPPQGTATGSYLKLERRVGDFATAGVAVALETVGRHGHPRGHRPHRRRPARRSTPPPPRTRWSGSR